MIKDKIVSGIFKHLFKSKKCILCNLTPSNQKTIYDYIITLEKRNDRLKEQNEKIKKEWGWF